MVDAGKSRIQNIDCDGNFITKWGTPGTGDGQFNQPTGLIVDPLDAVY